MPPYTFEIDKTLPINEITEEVKSSLVNHSTLIVQAPPGAGKSTLLPLQLLNEPWLDGKKIIMLEPRRLAAKSVASRLSQLLGEEVGRTVGYRIRFDTKISEHTKIEVVTEGILTRILHSDNTLEEYALVIFDEYHERSIHADTALAFCRATQEIIRPELRLLIMSATLNMDELSRLLDAPMLISQGRQYPIDIRYTNDTDLKLLPELTARVIKDAFTNHEGDILAFFPGQGEIMKCQEILNKTIKDAKILPLFGQLPYNKQRAAILPDKEGKRKIVLATSIAETSLTIEGVKIVVDTGYSRKQEFNPNTGLTGLITVPSTKDSADQRAGRAGRLSPGICYRMWTKATHARLLDHRTPEIQEADLTSLVLDLATHGTEAKDLKWLTPPPKGHLEQAYELLEQIDALDNRKITEHGKAIQNIPCHPRLAHMLLFAKEEGILGLATDLAAILEERDPLPKDAGIDINLRIEALRRIRKEDMHNKRFAYIEKVAASYRRIFEIDADNRVYDPYATGVLICKAYTERIACARPGNNAQFQLANGKLASAGHRDDLAHEPWLAVASMNAKEDMGRIFLASQLNPTDLRDFVEQKDEIVWNTKKGGLTASSNTCIGNIILKSIPLRNPSPELIKKAICKAIQKDYQQLLNLSKEFEQWQNRVLLAKKHFPDLKFPSVELEDLLENIEKWIEPYIEDIEIPEDIKSLDLIEILHYGYLTYDQQGKLDELFPLKIQAPSGSHLFLNYHSPKEPPIMAVKIQELFGLDETPKIAKEKITILMHLLSPGMKPVQVTSDLKSFWGDTYFEVRKELKRRYPKHHWPDKPMEEEAIRGIKRKP